MFNLSLARLKNGKKALKNINKCRKNCVPLPFGIGQTFLIIGLFTANEETMCLLLKTEEQENKLLIRNMITIILLPQQKNTANAEEPKDNCNQYKKNKNRREQNLK